MLAGVWVHMTKVGDLPVSADERVCVGSAAVPLRTRTTDHEGGHDRPLVTSPAAAGKGVQGVTAWPSGPWAGDPSCTLHRTGSQGSAGNRAECRPTTQ